MSEPEPAVPEQPQGHRLRSIEAAGLAGLIFGALYIAALILFKRQPGPAASATEIAEWLADDGAGDGAITALYFTSFAVIAFLWFIAVIRRRIGDREDRFFGTVFLGSGAIVAGVLLVGSSLLAASAYAVGVHGVTTIDAGDYAQLQSIGLSLLSVHGLRVAAVFMISTSTIVLRTQALPTWLAILGYVAALTMLVEPLAIIEEAIVFPAWVMLMSLVILIRRRELPPARQPEGEPTHVRL